MDWAKKRHNCCRCWRILSKRSQLQTRAEWASFVEDFAIYCFCLSSVHYQKGLKVLDKIQASWPGGPPSEVTGDLLEFVGSVEIAVPEQDKVFQWSFHPMQAALTRLSSQDYATRHLWVAEGGRIYTWYNTVQTFVEDWNDKRRNSLFTWWICNQVMPPDFFATPRSQKQLSRYRSLSLEQRQQLCQRVSARAKSGRSWCFQVSRLRVHGRLRRLDGGPLL